MAELAACTIVAKNYLPYARALARSFQAQHPGAHFTVLLADRNDGAIDASAEPFELIEVEALGIPDFEAMAFQYDVLELSTAVKPWLLEYLLERGTGKLLYLDPDILVLGPLGELAGLLDAHTALLTPHILTPYRDAERPGETDLLQCGTYNLGFLGLREGPAARALLEWWQRRCETGCIVLKGEGYFVDQKWMDLAPSLFPGVHVLRDPGYNVAYWNLHERRVVGLSPPRLEGGPLHFFHFSGFVHQEPETLSKHQTRFRLAQRPDLLPLFERYRRELSENGYEACRSLPYAFGSFDDGTPVPAHARRLWLSLPPADRARFGNPFETRGAGSFARWLHAPARMQKRHRPRGSRERTRALGFWNRARGSAQPGSAVTNLMYFVHQGDPGLRARFPDLFGRDRDDFLRWYRRRVTSEVPSGNSEPGVDDSANARLHSEGVLEPRFRAWPRIRLAAPGQRRLPQRREFGVNLAGYFRTESGVGQAARSMARALDTADVPRTLYDFDLSYALSREDRSFEEFSERNPYRVNLVHVNADQVRQFRKRVGRGWFRGRVNVAYWLWELPEFPDAWVDRMRHFDEIWTSSRFCVEAIAPKSPVPVQRVPIALDAEIESELVRSDFGLPEDRKLFLFCFDAASFLERKNPGGLIDAFRMACAERTDEVALVLKVAHADQAPEALETLRKRAVGLPVHWIERQLRANEVRNLIRLCDAYVSLHRSEGFGLTLAEAMAHARPVIATAWSGNADFTDAETALPVRHRMVELDEDVGPYARGQVWAEPDLEHAAERMRWVLDNETEAAAHGRRAARAIRSRLAPEVVGETARRRLERLG